MTTLQKLLFFSFGFLSGYYVARTREVLPRPAPADELSPEHAALALQELEQQLA